MGAESLVCVRNRETKMLKIARRHFNDVYQPGAAYTTIKVDYLGERGQLARVTLNRPRKMNAINTMMYTELQDCLHRERVNETTSVLMLTGAGPYFSSGNDLSGFAAALGSGMTPAQLADGAFEIMVPFVDAFIEFDKPLVAAVNGPAVGIGCSSLGLCDLVLASDNATFVTPFTRLGQSAEACSSFTFPRLMGSSKAAEMILFNKKITSVQAQSAGLVADVFPQGEFNQRALDRILEYASNPPKSLAYSKQLIRPTSEVENLKRINRVEAERLRERWASDDCFEAIMNFMMRK